MQNRNEINQADGIAQLCPNCGLCCDSTLFADVELRAGDQVEHLQGSGLELFPKTKSRLAFAQPCACFDGKFCGIYAERPKRCRLFECGLLQQVEAGKLTAGGALKKISSAKKQANHVRKLLRALGQDDERMPLAHRYSELMSAPMDLSKPNEAELRGELMLAVSELMTRLQTDFLR